MCSVLVKVQTQTTLGNFVAQNTSEQCKTIHLTTLRFVDLVAHLMIGSTLVILTKKI